MYVVQEITERTRKNKRKCLALRGEEQDYNGVDRRMLCRVLGKNGMSKINRRIRSM